MLYFHNPDVTAGETEGLSKDQKVTAFIQKYTQDEGKGLQASRFPLHVDMISVITI